MKKFYYFNIIYFMFWACYHCYVGNDISLITDAIMIMESFICLEIRNSKK